MPTVSPPTATVTPRVRFAVIGDYGWEGAAAAAVAALVRSWAPDFIVTTGDNNYPAGEARTIDQNIGQYYHEFIAAYQGAFGAGVAVNRFFPALGNHDFQTEGGAPYLDYFALPGNERYYSVTQGVVDFFVLHSTPGEPDGVAPNSRQATWLREALAASRACWKLVVMHHPPYSSAHHGSSGWMQWPYKAWGADVVLAGHDHVYERLLVDGLVYFTNGLGGAPRYAFKNPLPGSQARYNADHGAMLVEADQSKLRFVFMTRTGEVIDTYEMVKSCPPNP